MKLIRYLVLGVVVILVILVAVGAFVINSWTRGPLPRLDGSVALTGLDDTVEIIRDEYGIPHVYASTTHDLRFAQGYVHAQDRWWQMEFSRHIGSGTLQELTGKSDALMEADVFIRTVGWHRAAQNDWDTMPDDARAELEAFAEGVNAYITNRSASELAFEYNILGLTGVNIAIEPWHPIDTLVWTKVMSDDLGGNQSSERLRASLIDVLGQELVADYWPDYPFDDKPTIIQPDDYPSPNPISQSTTDPEYAAISNQTQLAGNYDASEGFIFGKGDGIGSNNWVVSGDLTASGMPLLANDPHLGIGMPSIWYEIGLYCEPVGDNCPYNVRGFAFPAVPGIIIGHNDHIGWGMTNVGWDTQDLYRITINPDNDLEYLWNDEWRSIDVATEEIHFNDDPQPITLTVRLTHLGPIINDNQIDEETGEILGFNNENPLAFRWTAYEVSTIYTALMQLNRAQNWDDFRAALSLWDTPSQNFVYADVEGNIGYQTPGNIPIRTAGHTGRLPVDGTTDEFEWRGYVPFEYLPSVFNPERGYISTANQALVPLSYYDYLAQELGEEYGDDAHFVFDYDWSIGYRGQRINELLAETDQHTIETFSAIQGDNKMIAAEEIAPTLATLDMGSDELNDARDWMLNWNYQLHMDSPQAALFMHFWRRLMLNLYQDQLGDIESPNGSGLNMWATTLLLDDATNAWWDDITTDESETRDDILIRSFAEGHAATIEELGADRDSWAWGQVHQADFISNPLGLSGIDQIENVVNVWNVPTSGGSDIVNATGWRLGDYSVRAVPSMRMILDFSDLSNSVTMHTTGQSGHPFSPHYDDFIDSWRMIEYHPMFWTRAQVDANQAGKLILQAE